jgi:hypothetical protein
MGKLYDAFVESTIIMGLLVLMFGATMCYMFAKQIAVPAELIGLESLFAGFWLRSKASVEVKKGLGYTPPSIEVTEE